MNNRDDQGDEEKKTLELAHVVIPPNSHILYTDTCYVASTEFGVVLDFVQTNSLNKQQTVVSRIGMSREHAEALLKVVAQKLIEEKMKAKSTRTKKKSKKSN